MRTPGRRGFTLAELLVGLVITSIVLAATTAIFLGVQRSYQAETEAKVITENGRSALLFFERTLPLAGFGIDPRVAFDVDGTATRDNQVVTGVTYTPAQPTITAPPNAVVSDELAFRYRDPSFLRSGRLNSGNTQLTVDAPFGIQIPQGKLLMVACRGGADYAMVRTGASALATASTVSVSNAGAPFINNSASCLADTGALSPWVFLVQEHRVRIVNLGGRPWLVSFRNLDASVTDLSLDNFDPIAPDVESFHIAFAMNRARPGLSFGQTPPDGTGGNWIIGDAAGETFFAQPTNVLTAPPDYRTGYERAERFTAHPANIRAVHVALVLRSSRTAPTGRQTAQSAAIFNGAAVSTPVNDGFLRNTIHTVVRTPNLLSRSGFVPQLRAGSETRDLNYWGG